jgi:hypothetical protein
VRVDCSDELFFLLLALARATRQPLASD